MPPLRGHVEWTLSLSFGFSGQRRHDEWTTDDSVRACVWRLWGGETSFEMQIQSCALYDAPSLAALARYFQCSRNNNK